MNDVAETVELEASVPELHRPPKPAPEIAAGTRIDQYLVKRLLGEGGMGRVYLARDTILSRFVALKLLKPELINADQSERLLEEARLAARLNHPHVVTIYGTGVFEDRPYVAMEHLDGPSLRERLTSGALSPSQAIGAAQKIAEALTRAHAGGVVHCDLKPENVIIADDRLRVLDFGLARLAGVESTILSGTRGYMAPEQWRAGPPSKAIDVWAFGVLLFELLTRKRPFAIDGTLSKEQILERLSIPPSFKEIEDPRLARLIAACLDVNPDRRPPIADVARALEARHALSAPKSSRRRWIAGVVIGAPLLALGISFARTSEPTTTPASSRLAVLPIDAPDDEASAMIADGITEELITQVAARSSHRTIARASVMRFRAPYQRDLREVAAQLGVEKLVVGKLEKTNDGVRLALELIDPRDLTVAWSKTYTRPESELEALSATAASELAAYVGGARVLPMKPRNPAAYRAYLNGRYFWAKRDETSLKKAIAYFEEAIAVDPEYARAWVGIADASALLPWMGPTPREEAQAKARAALQRALELDPNSSEAVATHGAQLAEIDWRFKEAEAVYRRALELDPENGNAHQWLGETLGLMRRFDEAMVELDRAIELDPLSPAIHVNRAKVLYYSGRFSEAAAAGQKALELNPHQPWGAFGLGYALVKLGRVEEGMATIREDSIFRVPGAEVVLRAQELWVAKQIGDRVEVARLLKEIEASSLGELTPWTMAFVYGTAEQPDLMIRYLELAFERRDLWTPFSAVQLEFDPYRKDPRFIAIMQRLGL